MREEDSGDDVSLDDSFFVDRDYELTTFNFGNSVLQLFCLRSASTDYDLTGQLVWPGAVLLNNYLLENSKMLEGLSVIELGSGVGITGILCSRFCSEVVLTDHNDEVLELVWPSALLLNNYLLENSKILEGLSVIELGSGVGITGILCSRFCSKVVLTDHNDEVLEILRKNIELESSSGNLKSSGLKAEKLEWGNCDHIGQILQKYPGGFDLILGADICFQQSSVPLLFRTVEMLFRARAGNCRFILAYVSRSKMMDKMVIDEAAKLGMKVNEVQGTKSIISNLEGVIYEIILPK